MPYFPSAHLRLVLPPSYCITAHLLSPLPYSLVSLCLLLSFLLSFPCFVRFFHSFPLFPSFFFSWFTSFFVSMSVSLSVRLPVCLSVYLSIYPSIFLPSLIPVRMHLIKSKWFTKKLFSFPGQRIASSITLQKASSTRMNTHSLLAVS